MNRVILACGFGLVSVVLLEGRAASESPILTPVDMAFGPDGSAVVTTTAGAFVRPAASKTFHFVCPAAFGSGASAFSPLVEIGESGTTSVTSFSGLFQSRGSCQFERATLYGQSSVIVFEERWIAAIESRSETTWIATADSHHRNDIYVSTGSREFRSLGLESGRNWFLSLHADESGRLYASGYRVANPGAKTRAEGFLLRDGAQLPARGLTFGRSGRARVVLTVGALTVWVVVEGALEPDSDVVYRSVDGGESFSRFLETRGRLVGARRAGNGSVWLAATGPCDPRVGSPGCLFRVAFDADDQIAAFDAAPTPPLTCLALHPDDPLKMIGCRGDTASSGVVLVELEWDQPEDASVRVEPYLLAADVVGPCQPSTLDCEPAWQSACKLLGANCKERGPTLGPSSDQSTRWLWLALLAIAACLPWLLARRRLS